MPGARHRALSTAVSIASTISLILILSPRVLAAPPAVPMAGERFLTSAERQAAAEAMTPNERAALGHLFDPGAPGLVVAHARREYVVVETDGVRSIQPVGPIRESPAGALSLPSYQVAGTTSITRAGTNLFISLTIVKTRSTAPYEWQVYEWAQWGTNGSYSPAGMDCCNNHEDTMAIAWAGGLALHADAESGRYQAWCVGEPASIDIYKSDVANNVGVAHSFHEWWDPDNRPMYYGHVDNRIRESTWQDRISNVSMKYFHTWGGFDYSVGFSGSGPSISLRPTTNSWSAVLSLSFTH